MGEKICCDICGYQFKTTQKLETHYHDYEEYEEWRTYPDPTDSNPAHLVWNYVCDKCYQDIGNTIRNKLIDGYESYMEKLPNRIEKERKKFEDAIKALEDKQKEVESVCQKLKNINYLFELSDEDTKQINNLIYVDGMYYLEKAIQIEREHVKDERKFCDWLEIFDIEDIKIDGGIYCYGIVDIKTFKNILQEKSVHNYSYKKMLEVFEKIDNYIASKSVNDYMKK